MPQRVYGIAIALTGLLFVLFLLLLRFDLQRAARKGPGWKRNLVLAGILALSTLGLVSCFDNQKKDFGGVPAASAKELENATEWKRLETLWQEAREITSGERGDYPFDEDGRRRLLLELNYLRKDILRLEEHGLVNTAEAELLRRELELLARGVARKRPTEMKNATCYKPMMVIPALDSLKRLSERVPLLGKLAVSKKLDKKVFEKVAATIEKDIKILQQDKMLDMLSTEEFDMAMSVRQQAQKLLQQVKWRFNPPRLPERTCYLPIRRPDCYRPAIPPGEKGSSNIKRQLELMKHLAQRGSVRPIVLSKVVNSLEKELEDIEQEADQQSQLETKLAELRAFLEGRA